MTQRPLLVLAGSATQADLWLRDQPAEVRRRAVVIHGPDDVRGYSDVEVVRAYGWRNRRDLAAIEQHLAFLGDMRAAATP